MKNNTLKTWEIALLLSLCLCLCLGTAAEAEGSRLSDGLIRLHVIAASDSEYEQALKLRVRDAVLSEIEPRLSSAPDRESALETVRSSLGDILSAAESASEGREITVSLGQEYYPTREYGTFSLPAGEYESLRVVIGAGEGKNWWCVVFPPLCSPLSEEAVAALGSDLPVLLDDSEPSVVFRFRLVELWGQLKAFFSSR